MKRRGFNYFLLTIIWLLGAVVLLWPVSAYADTEYRRPTAYTGGSKTTNPTYAYDNGTTPPNDTYSTSAALSTSTPEITFTTWQTTTYTYTALTLYVNRATTGYVDDTWDIQYTLNGGTSWLNLDPASSTNATRASVSVALTPSQNLSQVQIRHNYVKNKGSDSTRLMIYDIWTTGTYGTVTVGSTGTQTTRVVIPSTNNYLGGAFTLVRDAGTANATSFLISETGSVNATSYLSNLDLYYETAGTCTYNATETLFGTAASFNASQQATITGTLPVGTSQVCAYLVFDVASGALNDDVVDMQITNPSTQVVVASSTVTPATAVAISGSTTLSTNTLNVDIVDSGGSSVSNPSITFPAKNFTWDTQQSNATLGVSAQQIRVSNTTLTPSWTLSIAATGGPTSLWTGSSYSYDYNGTAATGRLTVNGSTSTITPKSGCSTTGLTQGTSTSFVQGSMDSVTLLSANASAGTNCYWDITGVSLTQDIPAGQQGDTYTINMTVSVI